MGEVSSHPNGPPTRALLVPNAVMTNRQFTGLLPSGTSLPVPEADDANGTRLWTRRISLAAVRRSGAAALLSAPRASGGAPS